MSYQTIDHAIGTGQNLALILENINASATTVADIGCNQGILACALALHGYAVHGIEGQEVFINHGINKSKNNHIKNVKFTHTNIGIENIRLIDGVDVAILLSVHHQMVKHTGLENGNKLLIEIFKSAKNQFFFQPATIYEKYGQEMPWPENDFKAIEEYFVKLFRPIRNFKFHNLGIVDNRLPNSEPFRPLYLFNFEESNAKINIPKSPFEVEKIGNQIYRIPVGKCMGHYWQSFSDDGWHFLREQVKQLKEINLAKVNLNVTESVLYKYYEDFQPVTIYEAAKKLNIKSSESLGILGNQRTKAYTKYELMDSNMTSSIRSESSHTSDDELMPDSDSYHCGPRNKDQIMKEITRLTQIYQSISRSGYKPDIYDDGYIRGNFVSNGNNWIFHVTGGNHRLATIAELDYKWLTVRLQPGRPKNINLNNLKCLPAIRSGAILESEASALYEPYFCNFRKII
jgi:mRNA-degrading endonuclease HigB of HigAB toxin-antitoxin module